MVKTKVKTKAKIMVKTKVKIVPPHDFRTDKRYKLYRKRSNLYRFRSKKTIFRKKTSISKKTLFFKSLNSKKTKQKKLLIKINKNYGQKKTNWCSIPPPGGYVPGTYPLRFFCEKTLKTFFKKTEGVCPRDIPPPFFCF